MTAGADWVTAGADLVTADWVTADWVTAGADWVTSGADWVTAGHSGLGDCRCRLDDYRLGDCRLGHSRLGDCMCRLGDYRLGDCRLPPAENQSLSKSQELERDTTQNHLKAAGHHLTSSQI